jgi:membrane fusion protein (multidrug efflux system)
MDPNVEAKENAAPSPRVSEGAQLRAVKDAEPKPPPAKSKSAVMRLRIILGVLVLLAGVSGWWAYARQFEDTDDAQTDANISAISPRIPGTVVAVRVVDNQAVKAGDLLVELDRNDLAVALAQARATVAQAEAAYEAESPGVSITETSNQASLSAADAELANSEADLEAAKRDLDQAEANNRYAQQQLVRAKKLVASGAMTVAEFDQSSSAADAARASVNAARKHVDQRRAHLLTAQARLRETRLNTPRQLVVREAELEARKASLELARAQLKQAELNLSYAGIVAPVDGIVGKKSVNIGDRVQPGQQLLALTQTDEIWVTANFRETQIGHLRIGQRASVHVDAIGRDYRGVVESFGGATGSRYSLLPPENATGNYVKVVQRLPVRIRLEPGQPEIDRLRPGMSVEPKVRVR